MLRDEDREYLANQVMGDDEPEPIDPNLLRVIRDLTAAVKAIKAPTIPAFDVGPVAKAISGMPSFDEIRGDIQALAQAVDAMRPANLEGIERALMAIHASNMALIDAMKATKEVEYDAAGKPTRLRTVRTN